MKNTLQLEANGGGIVNVRIIVEFTDDTATPANDPVILAETVLEGVTVEMQQMLRRLRLYS